jgi:hypothetical protein
MHDASRLQSPAKPEWMARNIRLLGRQFRPGRQVRIYSAARQQWTVMSGRALTNVES